MARYIVEYGSDSQYQARIESNSRDAKRHGREMLGSSGGGYVRVYRKATGEQVSYARYTPEGKGSWYSACF